MTDHIRETVLAPRDTAGSRFDQVAAELFPDYSRSQIQRWIKDGSLTLEGRTVKPNTKLGGGEHLVLHADLEPERAWEPEALPLNIIYADSSLIVVDKQVGLVVHPAAGNWRGTLLNGLIYQFPELALLPRAGIVHRLDKDTSGLMAIARTLEAQTHLVAQLQERSVKRQYLAAVAKAGLLDDQGLIDEPIGRHPTIRTKMAVVKAGKPARTHFQVLSRNNENALLRLDLETGRTHQIRVHMAFLGHPLIGDPVYGRSFSLSQEGEHPFVFSRQALHATRLGLNHPLHGEYCQWDSVLPHDFQQLLRVLGLERV